FVRLCGLAPKKVYHLEGTEKTCTGAALMHGGLPFVSPMGDYPAVQFHLTAEN
ncbi:MAG: GH36 C-terminal domain-containing protein, partial [Clostridia bacterium]|nr:GH36 C-terminal domain-containing protein [Clostridia bacterium]